MIMVDWTPLRSALARCRDTNTPLPIWWRDDDAIEPTPALDQLSTISEKIGMPIHLATIPKTARDTLVPFIREQPHIVPCVHGWNHINTAPSGLKKSEFGVPRDTAEQDLKQALDRMKHLFGDEYLALFVPPWNRIDVSLPAVLASLNFSGFSTYGPRPKSAALPQINTHIDPIFWRGHRGLADPTSLIAQAAEILDARCNCTQDATEPFGLLTHHLVHVPEVWEFSANFMIEMLDGGAYPANLKEILT
jgi:hypothetical protein